MNTIHTSDYTIYIAEKLSECPLKDYIEQKNYTSVYILLDTHTQQYCLPILEASLHPMRLQTLLIEAGEEHKNIETCKALWQNLVALQADRKSLLINLGGGVIGDMGGFVASTFKRGFDFINIPTTLLAQVDASVGGKLGIDFEGMKNLVGVFNNPKAIFICTEFLKTLPSRQFMSGFAEVIKHALIADETYWNQVKSIQLDKADINWQSIIETSVNIKKRVVEADMYESGLRKTLNFGHTIGHAVETYSLLHDEDPLLHGEAIVVGMICETLLSVTENGLDKTEANAIIHFLRRQYKKYDLQKIPYDALLAIMKQDKKNTGTHISFSLLDKTGSCGYDFLINEENIIASFHQYNTLACDTF